MKKLSGWSKKATIILFWLIIWQAFSAFIKNKIFLVGPIETLQALSVLVVSRDFWGAIWFSFARISLGFFLAFFAGLITGALAYWKPLIDEFLAPPIHFMKSIPVASFVILALIWTGSENLSVFISFLVVYPMIHVNTLAGLQSTDPKLLEMARVFQVPIWRRAMSIYRVSLYPYLASAMKTALGMGFKSGIAAEVIGVPTGSIGEGLYMSKIYLSTAELFAWTLVIILVSVAFEKVFLLVLRKAAGKGVVIHDDGKTE
ncbi:MAG: ABC transporter permease subunit [Lachnospiraceae bacterium]|nr:ABC transporter permease subunit [Lachnospiraceae bacterium]